MVKSKASWKGLDRKLFLTSDFEKDITECLCLTNPNATQSLNVFMLSGFTQCKDMDLLCDTILSDLKHINY